MKLTKFESTTVLYEDAATPVIRAEWQEDNGNTMFEEYHGIRAGLVYPTGMYPGYLLIAGQTLETKLIRVLKELSFDVLGSLIEQLPGLMKTYFLDRIYHDDSQEALAFSARISKTLGASDTPKGFKLPTLHPSYRSDSPTFGNDLIRLELKDKKLLISGDSELARQMSSGWAEAYDERQLYGVKALRHIVCSFYDQPFRLPFKRPRPVRVTTPGAWMVR